MGAAIIATAIGPAVLDQATTDTSGMAWTALGCYLFVVSVVFQLPTRQSVTMFCLTLTTLATAQVATAAMDVKLSSLTVLPVAFALYGAGAHSLPKRSGAALAAGAALVVTALLINHLTAPEGRRGGSDVLAFVAALPAAWALGVAARNHRLLLIAAEQRTADARSEQILFAERAAAAERARIARDMHDVVAHSLTLLVVHAETVRARSDELPPWARDRVDSMAMAGRQATTEMRELLQVLRGGAPATVPPAPAPTFAALPTLVQDARTAGNHTTLTTTGDLTGQPKTVQLTGYRVVQEGLANARRHAPGSDVDIRIVADDHAIALQIDSGPPPAGPPSAPGSGVGLPGLRERLTALGGTFDSGPTPDGGFRLAGTIPLDAGADHALA